MNSTDWYASPNGIFVRMYNAEKDLHVLPKFSTDKLVMQEVIYHILTRLSIGFHKKKMTPWPMLPLQIGLYVI